MSKRLLAHIALFTANLIYGINYTVAKDVMPDFIQPLGFIFLRVSGAVLLFWLCYRLFFYEKVVKRRFVQISALRIIWCCHQSNVIFRRVESHHYQCRCNYGYQSYFGIDYGCFLATEAITKRKILGIALGATGAISLITYGGAVELNSDHFWGNIMVLINAASYGVYLVLVKPLMQKYKPITVISWVFLFGFIYVIPFGWGEFQVIEWTSMPTNILWKAAL